MSDSSKVDFHGLPDDEWVRSLLHHLKYHSPIYRCLRRDVRDALRAVIPGGALLGTDASEGVRVETTAELLTSTVETELAGKASGEYWKLKSEIGQAVDGKLADELMRTCRKGGATEGVSKLPIVLAKLAVASRYFLINRPSLRSRILICLNSCLPVELRKLVWNGAGLGPEALVKSGRGAREVSVDMKEFLRSNRIEKMSTLTPNLHYKCQSILAASISLRPYSTSPHFVSAMRRTLLYFFETEVSTTSFLPNQNQKDEKTEWPFENIMAYVVPFLIVFEKEVMLGSDDKREHTKNHRSEGRCDCSESGSKCEEEMSAIKKKEGTKGDGSEMKRQERKGDRDGTTEEHSESDSGLALVAKSVIAFWRRIPTHWQKRTVDSEIFYTNLDDAFIRRDPELYSHLGKIMARSGQNMIPVLKHVSHTLFVGICDLEMTLYIWDQIFLCTKELSFVTSSSTSSNSHASGKPTTKSNMDSDVSSGLVPFDTLISHYTIAILRLLRSGLLTECTTDLSVFAYISSCASTVPVSSLRKEMDDSLFSNIRKSMGMDVISRDQTLTRMIPGYDEKEGQEWWNQMVVSAERNEDGGMDNEKERDREFRARCSGWWRMLPTDDAVEDEFALDEWRRRKARTRHLLTKWKFIVNAIILWNRYLRRHRYNINQRMLQEFEAKRKLAAQAAQAAETRASTVSTKPDAEATERLLPDEPALIAKTVTKEMEEIAPEPVVTMPKQILEEPTVEEPIQDPLKESNPVHALFRLLFGKIETVLGRPPQNPTVGFEGHLQEEEYHIKARKALLPRFLGPKAKLGDIDKASISLQKNFFTAVDKEVEKYRREQLEPMEKEGTIISPDSVPDDS